ncbi:MAG: heme exporter protein D [Paracoccaceae bacterium]|jgi:heme exporter protein D
MMPDLGKYAVEVTSAYIVSLVLIGVLVWLSWRKSKQVRLALEALEADLRKGISR